MTSTATGSRIGYYISGESAVPFYCPSGKLFAINQQYGLCDPKTRASGVECLTGGIPDGWVLQTWVYTSDTHTGTISDSDYCPTNAPCATVTLHENFDESGSSFTMFSCRDSIGLPRGVSKAYITIPSTMAIITSTAGPSTEGTSGRNGLVQSSSSTALAPIPTESITQTHETQAGVIAGAVVGSVVGVGLIIAALVFAFQLGKRRSRQGHLSNETVAPPVVPIRKATPVDIQNSSPRELGAENGVNGQRAELGNSPISGHQELAVESGGAFQRSELQVESPSHHRLVPETGPSRYELEHPSHPSPNI